MKQAENLSQAKMVLLAIYKVAKSTGNRIPFEELVIQAWKDFPEEFSLRNHPEYPDSYRIYNRIYTTLITERWLVSLRKQVFRLTDKGLDLAKEIESLTVPRSEELILGTIKLTRDEEDFLQYAVRSRALSAWKQNNKEALIDYDARTFFQFSTGTPIRERKRKVENARDAIHKAVKLGMSDSMALNDLFQFLTQKYKMLFDEG